jgi:hypothetical protein
MKHALTTTVSRRVWLSRLLLAAAMAPVMGATLADGVDAKVNTVKTKLSIKARVKNDRDICEIGGGTLTVDK